MANNKTTLAVDPKFFKELFEVERKKMQERIGVTNLSQPNFSKMIIGFKLKQPKMDLSQVNTRIKGKKNVKL